ncbi:YcjF family protein [Gluconobacter cerinus]|uniref:GTPase n=1 Tax=Gluconobacter cerinus TaxID=38307 RepID=A0AAV5NBD5_9PROT|nr:DUF697 domain-containing protein [Gluconobacter cerinus]GLQ61474.1 GTPase [Gluconobacter cerinus]
MNPVTEKNLGECFIVVRSIPSADSILKLKDDALGFWDEISKKHKKANILICGKTGVGKSTLINAVFRDKLAETGIGRPVTQKLSVVSVDGVPLNILDTKGLELEDYQVIRDGIINEVRRRRGHDGDDYVHVAWLCIAEPGKRIEDAEFQLAWDLHELGVKVIVVLTKSHSFIMANEFVAIVKAKFEGLAHAVVQTRAIKTPRYDDDENVVGAYNIRGIDELIHVSYEVIPEAQQQAFANALNIETKEGLQKKKEEAAKIITVSSAAAAAIGATPIPFSDAILLFPVQATMIVKISTIFGMSVTKSSVLPVLTTLIGSSTATLVGKTVVTGIMKMVPGLGSFIGGALSATVANRLTSAMGSTYVDVLVSLTEEGRPLELGEALNALKNKIGL